MPAGAAVQITQQSKTIAKRLLAYTVATDWLQGCDVSANVTPPQWQRKLRASEDCQIDRAIKN